MLILLGVILVAAGALGIRSIRREPAGGRHTLTRDGYCMVVAVCGGLLLVGVAVAIIGIAAQLTD